MQKYTLSISLNGETRRLIVARAPDESEQHIALKLLAYVLYFHERPTVECSVGQHYKPDLVCVENGYVKLWIDCGDIGYHKLDRISTTNHLARIVVVKPTWRTATAYKRQADKRVRRPERINYVSFDPGFLDAFVCVLSTRSALVAQINEQKSELGLELNGQTLKTRVHYS